MADQGKKRGKNTRKPSAKGQKARTKANRLRSIERQIKASTVEINGETVVKDQAAVATRKRLVLTT